MRIRISAKGQVLLPLVIRERLDLRPGDPLDAEIRGDHLVLIPRKIRMGKARIMIDPVTGLPVLSAGSNAKPLARHEVVEILNYLP